MNGAHVHLLVNHFPIIGMVLGTLMWAGALFLRSEAIKRFCLGYFVVIGLTSAAAFFSGEPAEEVLEQYSQINHQLVEQHEEIAELSVIMNATFAVFSLWSLYLFRKSAMNRAYSFIVLGGAVAVASAMMVTGYYGGQINHIEVRQIGEPVSIGEPGNGE